MFVTITRIDAKGNERENLVNVDEIVTVLEVRQEPQTLYDEDGNEVETRNPTEKLFALLLTNGTKFTIKEDTYNTLVKKLVK